MLYCRLPNGNLVSKREIDKAIELVSILKDGFTVFDDEELFIKGNKVDAIHRYHQKHNTTLLEAKEAIELLRNE